MHQPDNNKNCPVCRVKVEIGSKTVQGPNQEQSLSRTKKYMAKLSTLNNQIYQQYLEFIRILDHQLKDEDINREQLKKAGATLVTDPFSENLPLDSSVKNAIENIFSRETYQTSGGVSTIAGIPNETPYDVLSSKRMELLTLLLKVQKLKRKLNLSKPTTKVLQIIKWQHS